jgi:hypothetical protein
MSKVQASSDLSTIKPEELQKYTTLALNDIVQTVNGKLEFGPNISGRMVVVQFTAANTDTTMAHGLGKTPSGYLVIGLSASMIVYNGTVANTSTNVILRSSAIGTATLFVF